MNNCIECYKKNEITPCHECNDFKSKVDDLQCLYCGDSSKLIKVNSLLWCPLCDTNFVPEDLYRAWLKEKLKN